MLSYQVKEWGRPLEKVWEETPTPQGTEVLVRVQACGVCHSDLHIREGAYDLGAGKKMMLNDIDIHLPLTMGHEIVGTIKAVGPESNAQVGAKGVVYPWIGCGQCRHCTNGNELDCEAPCSLGTRRAGGYADHVLVPHARYVLPYEGIDPLVAASAACSGLTAYSALKKLPLCGDSDTVVIIGAGGLGLAALGLIRQITPAKVVAVDVNPQNLELARPLADAVIVSNAKDSLTQLREFAQGGAYAVIDFVGLPQTFEWGMSALRKGGTLIVVGLFGGGTHLSIPLLPMRNLRVIGSYVGSLAEFSELLEILGSKPIVSVPVQSRPISEINEIFQDIHHGRVAGRVIATI